MKFDISLERPKRVESIFRDLFRANRPSNDRYEDKDSNSILRIQLRVLQKDISVVRRRSGTTAIKVLLGNNLPDSI